MDRAFAAALLTVAALGTAATFFDLHGSPVERLDLRMFNAAIALRWAYEYAIACDVQPPKTRKAPFWQSWFRTAPQGA